jgi:dipeptidase E
MGKRYFLGGENVFKRDAKEINEKAFQDAGGAPDVLVFAWARPSFDKKYLRRKKVFDYFRSLGARAVDFAEYSDLPKDIVGKVECSDLIYFTGGQASILVERIKNKDFDGVLRKYDGVIVGRSAGALALCRRFVATDRNTCSTKIVDGLGHVDFCMKAHYKPSKDNVLRRLSKQEKIYAVPQRAAIVYDNGSLSLMDTVYLFENGEKQVLDGTKMEC